MGATSWVRQRTSASASTHRPSVTPDQKHAYHIWGGNFVAATACMCTDHLGVAACCTDRCSARIMYNCTTTAVHHMVHLSVATCAQTTTARAAYSVHRPPQCAQVIAHTAEASAIRAFMHQPLLQCCCPLGSRHGSARIQGETLRSGGSGASTAAAGSTKVCLHNGFTTVNINAKRATKLTRPSLAHGSSTSYYYRHVQWNPEDLERKDGGATHENSPTPDGKFTLNKSSRHNS